MTTLTAFGSSMFPFVPSRSTLELAALDGASAQVHVGEILAYVGRAGVIAHRVIAVERSGSGERYQLRGDAQDFSESVGREALAYRVTRVSCAGVCYATSGRLGRTLALLALRRGWGFRCLRVAALRVAALRVAALRVAALRLT
jgi:hypothetical protein